MYTYSEWELSLWFNWANLSREKHIETFENLTFRYRCRCQILSLDGKILGTIYISIYTIEREKKRNIKK